MPIYPYNLCHDDSGGGGGKVEIKWYTEDSENTYPIIDVDPNLSQIGMGNPEGGYVQLKFITGGNNGGHILSDDGTLTLHKSEGSEFNLMDKDVNLLVSGTSVLNSSGDYTNLVATGSSISLSPNFAGMSSTGGAFELDGNRGIKLYGNGGVKSVIDATPSQVIFGDNAVPTHIQGDQIVLDSSDKTSTITINPTSIDLNRGKSSLLLSDAQGSVGYNNMLRMAWNDAGWNVSQNTFVAFSSRATYSVVLGPKDSRIEANTEGVMLTSDSYNTNASILTMINGSTLGKIGKNTEPYLEASSTSTTLRYIGNELKLNDSNNTTLNSGGNDVILNAPAGHVTFNALGQSMSIGPAGLRYTVDGVDIIQSGSTTGRSAPDLTIHRPGGGDMSLGMTLDNATLQAGADSKVQLTTNGGALLSGKDGYVYIDVNGVKVTSNSGNQLWCTNGQYIQGDTSYGYSFLLNGVATLDIEAQGSTLSHPKNTSVWVSNKTHLHMTDEGFSFATTGATGPLTERLSITEAGQITAPANYTPLGDGDLVTKKYVDKLAPTLKIGKYNLEDATPTVVPGSNVYYSVSSPATGNALEMYAPGIAGGYKDIIINAPGQRKGESRSLTINGTAMAFVFDGQSLTSQFTIPAGTFVRLVALPDEPGYWLAITSGGQVL